VGGFCGLSEAIQVKSSQSLYLQTLTNSTHGNPQKGRRACIHKLYTSYTQVIHKLGGRFAYDTYSTLGGGGRYRMPSKSNYGILKF